MGFEKIPKPIPLQKAPHRLRLRVKTKEAYIMAEIDTDKIIGTLLSSYLAKKSSVSLDDFLSQEMAVEGFDPEEIDEFIRDVSETIAVNTENHRHIEEYKQKDLTKANWLRDFIDKETESMDDKKRLELLGAVKNTMSEGTGALLGKMSQENVTSKIEEFPKTKWEKPGKNLISGNLVKEIDTNAMTRFIALAGIMPLIKGEANDQ